jgi:membrane dipeptidase
MFKRIFFQILLLAPGIVSAQAYKKLHFNSIVADTHNDILTTALEKGFMIDQDLTGKTHSDFNRFKKAGVDVQVFSVWCDGFEKNLMYGPTEKLISFMQLRNEIRER